MVKLTPVGLSNDTGSVTLIDATGLAIAATNTVISSDPNTSSTAVYPTFVSATTGKLPQAVSSKMTFIPSTGTLTATTFTGALTGSCSGSSTSCSGTAATATNVAIESATNVTTNTYYPTFVTSSVAITSIKLNTDISLKYDVAASSIGTLTCGKFNATGGADFAEYMKKTDNGLTTPFNIEPGDICGIDKNGLLTNVFLDSFHFCVKSTSPCIIAQVADNTEQMEPIAFCGRVPVNVFNCLVGDYIIPIEKDVGGGISGMNIQSAFITFDQYRTSLGKVIRINEDGTAEIIVKIV